MPAINGTVHAEGDPLGGAYVRLIGPSDEFVAEIYTRDDGAFTFHVTEGTWRIETRAAGRSTVTRAIDVTDEGAAVSIDV